jgi:hypothetical protein
VTPQLLFYAMCWSDYNKALDTVVLSITHQPSGKGDPQRLWDRATPLMIEQFRMDLHEAWRVTTLDRRPKAGAHCQWCPSAAWCPAALA